jgi:hypothetical protein
MSEDKARTAIDLTLYAAHWTAPLWFVTRMDRLSDYRIFTAEMSGEAVMGLLILPSSIIFALFIAFSSQSYSKEKLYPPLFLLLFPTFSACWSVAIFMIAKPVPY